MAHTSSKDQKTIHLRSRRELRMMRQAGLLVWEAHKIVREIVKPGVNVLEIDAAVDRFFAEKQATPTFKGYPGEVPFPAATCISVNEQVVHGIPRDRVIEEGDLVGVDIGCKLNGWCGDSANTYPAGEISAEAQQLMAATQEALDLAIELMGKEKRWSAVADKMARYVRARGFSMVEALAGHGIGREMHEPPQAPHYYDPKTFPAKEDFLLRPGLVLAIEPMVNAGGKDVEILADRWTIVTKDRSLSAHFEHTVALTKNGPMRLTGSPDEPNLLA